MQKKYKNIISNVICFSILSTTTSFAISLDDIVINTGRSNVDIKIEDNINNKPYSILIENIDKDKIEYINQIDVKSEKDLNLNLPMEDGKYRLKLNLDSQVLEKTFTIGKTSTTSSGSSSGGSSRRREKSEKTEQKIEKPIKKTDENIEKEIETINFKDINNHWAKEYIEKLSSDGVVGGYKDGTFKPQNNITRAEFSKIILNILDEDLVNYNNEFKDVKSSDWHSDYIGTMKKLGIINGYQDNTFKPNGYITRAEIATIFSNILKSDISQLQVEEILKKVNDTNIPNWSKTNIAVVIENKIMVGDNNNQFNPLKNATRAEAVKAIYEFSKIK